MIGRRITLAAAGLTVGALALATTMVYDTVGGQAATGPLTCSAPGLSTPTGAPTGPASWGPEQISNATTVTTVTLTAVSDPAHPDFARPALTSRAAVIAVATAMQESALRNLDHGDRDSLGLFQQRPSQGWGSPDQIMDPAYSTNAFLARLIHVPDWATRPLTVVAQAVQRSAFPDAYAPWEADATAIVTKVTGDPTSPLDCQGGPGLPPGAPADARAAVALRAAESQLGTAYIWAGGNADGPTTGAGVPCDPGTNPAGCGFDCSGLMIYAWAPAGVTLPHFSGDQAAAGRRVPLNQALPGDLIFLSGNGSDTGIHHVAMIYYPDGSTPRIIEAQQTGVPVHIRAYRGAGEPEIRPYAVRLT